MGMLLVLFVLGVGIFFLHSPCCFAEGILVIPLSIFCLSLTRSARTS